MSFNISCKNSLIVGQHSQTWRSVHIVNAHCEWHLRINCNTISSTVANSEHFYFTSDISLSKKNILKNCQLWCRQFWCLWCFSTLCKDKVSQVLRFSWETCYTHVCDCAGTGMQLATCSNLHKSSYLSFSKGNYFYHFWSKHCPLFLIFSQ